MNIKTLKQIIKHQLIYIDLAIFGGKRNGLSIDNVEQEVFCCSKDVVFFANTPNTIIYYNNGTDSGFFRECRLHENKHLYLQHLLEDYCKYVFANNHSEECFDILQHELSDSKNFRMFFTMGAGTASYTRISKFRKSLNGKYIGLSGRYPKWFSEQLLNLVQFVWGPLDEYRYSPGRGMYQTHNSCSTITTKMVADYLGISSLIPETKYIKLTFDGKTRVGVSVAAADGQSPDSFDTFEEKQFTASFQNNLLNLHILDTICYQKDHRPGNYFVSLNEYNELVGINAFDNDCPTTFLSTGNVRFRSYCNCKPLINDSNEFAYPYISEEIYSRIMEIEEDEFESVLRKELSNVKAHFTIMRFKKIKIALKAAASKKKICIYKNDSKFDKKIIVSELKGDFGMTYMRYFFDIYGK